ncbi:hypothetical protein OS493_032516 [Desmophyllum pertusum]|uniref:Uncharacterized protein n=1 Tax=Desmophyllum pertusum TaxID=174260 RepID=A0A9X0CUS1_9CNID|nr:hypothetical protein OS493_032516 [Desmophyllum pertusum]
MKQYGIPQKIINIVKALYDGIGNPHSNLVWVPYDDGFECTVVDEDGTSEWFQIKTAVKHSQIYICDFHHEQAWERWLAKSSNGLTDHKQRILAKLRAIARAQTEQEYLEKLGELKNSAQEQFKELHHKDMAPTTQANGYGHFLTTINTNNGVERQNKAFKYNYLEGNRHATLSGTWNEIRYQCYNPGIPSYLRERPYYIVRHCLDRLPLAEPIPKSHVDVIDITNGVFVVRSQSGIEEKKS